MGVLTVFLDKCTNLKDADGAGNESDVYVVMHLEKDQFGPLDEDHGTKESSKKQGELSPEFGEEFSWEIPEEGLADMMLQIKVMDSDVGLDDKLGSCCIMLAELGLSEDDTSVERVVDNNIFCKDGKIFMTMKYTE